MKSLIVFLAVVTYASAGYLGCWRDDGARVMVKATMYVNRNLMSAESCIARCAQQNYAFAGTQYAQECFCGNDFTRLGKLGENSCNMACRGNPGEKCGGSWALSVYTTGAQDNKMSTRLSTFRIFMEKVNANVAAARCQLLGEGYQLASATSVQALNLLRAKMEANVNIPPTKEFWIGGKTPKPHHAKLNNAELADNSGNQNRIISNWPNQDRVWNIYSKTYNGARSYICEKRDLVDLGCWRDDGARVMVKATMQSINNQTPQNCIDRCTSLDYAFAGTQYSKECFCGNDFTRLGKADNCNMKCSGSEEICGGSWALNVYRTGLDTPCEAAQGDCKANGLFNAQSSCRTVQLCKCVNPVTGASSKESEQACPAL